MQLFQTQITLVNPNTGNPVSITIWIEAPNQGVADQIAAVLQDLSAYVGNAATLRAVAVQLIADIDAQGA